MRDGRPNPDIWGNIITCVEIGQGIYCIIGRDKRGIEMPKETAEKVLNEAVLKTGNEETDGNICFTDGALSNIVADILEKNNLIKKDETAALSELLRHLKTHRILTIWNCPYRILNRTSLNYSEVI